jgi:hypothetical protein
MHYAKMDHTDLYQLSHFAVGEGWQRGSPLVLFNQLNKVTLKPLF